MEVLIEQFLLKEFLVMICKKLWFVFSYDLQDDHVDFFCIYLGEALL